MKAISHDLLEEIKRRLVAEFQPEQIILFGSHAWGTPHDDSDLDLLIIVADSNLLPVERAQRAYLALGGLTVPTEILVKTRAEVEHYRPVYASLTAEILEKGKVLYERCEPRTSAGVASASMGGSPDGA